MSQRVVTRKKPWPPPNCFTFTSTGILGTDPPRPQTPLWAYASSGGSSPTSPTPAPRHHLASARAGTSRLAEHRAAAAAWSGPPASAAAGAEKGGTGSVASWALGRYISPLSRSPAGAALGLAGEVEPGVSTPGSGGFERVTFGGEAGVRMRHASP